MLGGWKEYEKLTDDDKANMRKMITEDEALA